MAQTLKRCPTCDTPHPDDVTTSHHPNGCTCGLSFCKGTGPEGCIWMRTLHFPHNPNVSHTERLASALMKQAELIAEWEMAQGRTLSDDDSKLLELLKRVK